MVFVSFSLFLSCSPPITSPPNSPPTPRLKAHMKPLMNICTHSAQAWDFTVYETVIRKTAKKTTVIGLY